MNGNNLLFGVDPFAYAQQRVISAMNMSVANKDALGPGTLKTAFNFVFTLDYEAAAKNQVTSAVAVILEKVDNKKRSKFDLEPAGLTNMVMLRAVSTKDGAVNTGNGSEAALKAYWCPYIPIGSQGHLLAGVPFVEFPRNLPARSYVFTGAMNGCSLVVTDAGNGNLRLYHDSTHTIGLFNGLNVLTSLGYDGTAGCAHTYAHAGPLNGVRSSFNFLYFDGNHWFMVSQPQIILNGQTMQVGLNPNIAPFQVQI